MKRHIVKESVEFSYHQKKGSPLEPPARSINEAHTHSRLPSKSDGNHCGTVQNNGIMAVHIQFLSSMVAKGSFIVVMILLATSAAILRVHKMKASIAEQKPYVLRASLGSQGKERANTDVETLGSNRRRLFGEVLKEAFPFARNPTEFRHQVTFVTKSDNDKTNNNYQVVTEEDLTTATPEFVYSKEDLALILRSLYTLLGFLNMPLWSGSPAYQHFIGTGSCLARLKRPASEVALGLLHGIYVQSWHPELNTVPADECQRRNLLRSVLGSEMEELVFYQSAIFGNGPQHSCLHVYKDLLLQSRGDNTNNQTIQRVVESIPYHFLLCDEIEEFLGGDVPLANNWKRREDHHFDLLQDIARLIEEPKLVSWIETARHLTLALYNTSSDSPAIHAYQEITPRFYKAVYNRSVETFRTDANPVEVDRMKFVQDTSRKEWPMLTAYFKPGESANFYKAILDTRASCDQYEISSSSHRGSGSISSSTLSTDEETMKSKASLDDYIFLLDELRTQTLSYCEQKELLIPDTIPFPIVPPETVVRSRFK
jgi:hypothetical protein